MQKCIVVTVSEYGGTPAEAEEAIRESLSGFEGKQFVYAAETLNDLPHPMQIPAISQHFMDDNTGSRTPQGRI